MIFDLITYSIVNTPSIMKAYRKWCCARPGVVGFEQMLKLSLDLLIFSMVNTLSLLALN